jgi:hypothetical protein
MDARRHVIVCPWFFNQTADSRKKKKKNDIKLKVDVKPHMHPRPASIKRHVFSFALEVGPCSFFGSEGRSRKTEADPSRTQNSLMIKSPKWLLLLHVWSNQELPSPNYCTFRFVSFLGFFLSPAMSRIIYIDKYVKFIFVVYFLFREKMGSFFNIAWHWFLVRLHCVIYLSLEGNFKS